MVSSTAVLPILQHVTASRLNKLAHQTEKFETNKAATLADVAAEQTRESKVRALLDGCKKHNIATGRSGISVRNVKGFLAQS